MRCVPSKTQIRDYSEELALLFGDGPHIAISRIADMCDYVVQAERPNIVTMCRLFEDAECPILYRTAVQPLYPLPEFLPTLCRQFDVYWQSVLVGRFNHVDEVLWTLGALFRSIKPFNYGNAIIGHLMTAQAGNAAEFTQPGNTTTCPGDYGHLIVVILSYITSQCFVGTTVPYLPRSNGRP